MNFIQSRVNRQLRHLTFLAVVQQHDLGKEGKIYLNFSRWLNAEFVTPALGGYEPCVSPCVERIYLCLSSFLATNFIFESLILHNLFDFVDIERLLLHHVTKLPISHNKFGHTKIETVARHVS